MISFIARDPVAKARPRRPAAPAPTLARLEAQLARAARVLEPDTADVFLRAIDRVLRAKPLGAIARQLVDGGALDDLFDELPRALQPWADLIEQATLTGATQEADRLLSPEYVLDFQLVNERSVTYGAERSGSLIRGITSEQRAQVRTIVGRALSRGEHPREAARYIREVVGLDPRSEAAVARMRAQMAKTLPREQVAARVQEYAGRLRRVRAETIARTEMLTATNKGREATWAEAAAAGYIDRTTAKREWSVGTKEGACPVCRPMHGKRVALDEPWTLPTGRMVDTPTQAHPRCRCTQLLILPGVRKTVGPAHVA